jgi:hypothetical protein
MQKAETEMFAAQETFAGFAKKQAQQAADDKEKELVKKRTDALGVANGKKKVLDDTLAAAQTAYDAKKADVTKFTPLEKAAKDLYDPVKKLWDNKDSNKDNTALKA